MNVLYDFHIRGEFEDPAKLGQIRGASVTIWPMAVVDGVVMRGQEPSPTPIKAGDPIPKEVADVINIAALATIEDQKAQIAGMEAAGRDLFERAEKLAADLRETKLRLSEIDGTPEHASRIASEKRHAAPILTPRETGDAPPISE